MALEERNGLSSVVIKTYGKVVDKKNGKEIRNEYVIKIYSDKLGEEARKELVAIKNKFDNKKESATVEETNPPLTFTSGAI